MNVSSAQRRRAVALVLTVAASGLVACGSAPHPTARPKPTPTAVPTVNPAASFEAKYASIHSGLTLDTVRGIMGSAGSTIAEADNGAGNTSMVIQWQDTKSSHTINVDFVNNVVLSKSANGF